jgi:hypothetical protein
MNAVSVGSDATGLRPVLSNMEHDVFHETLLKKAASASTPVFPLFFALRSVVRCGSMSSSLPCLID